MKVALVAAAVVAAAALMFGIYMVDIDMTEEGSLPDVDVSVESGSLPEYEAKVGDVEMGTKEVTVTVPTVDVQPPAEEDRIATND